VAWPDTGSFTAWTYRKQIDVGDTYVDALLSDFPVRVHFEADADLASALATGYDIRFTAGDGETPLYYERESWSGGGGSSVTADFWVKVSSILASGGATIYVYYDNAGASDGEDAANVWDSDYRLVMHLDETGTGSAGDYKDSTANGHDSANTTNEPSQVDGKIGKAQSFNGTSQRIAVGNITNPTNITINAWINVVNDANTKDIFTLEDPTGYPTYIFRVVGTNLRYGYAITVSDYEVWQNTLGDLPTGSFVYVSAVQTGNNTPILYINDAPVDVSVQVLHGTPTKANTLLPAGIGAKISTLANFYKGTADEIRVSDIARSAAWIKFEYHNIFETDNCLTIGSEESASPPTGVPWWVLCSRSQVIGSGVA
jgi:Domain of unknown function (DUF2341)